MNQIEKTQAELMVKAQEYAYATMAEGMTLEQAISKWQNTKEISNEGTDFLILTSIKFTYAGGCDLSPALH